MLAIITTNLLRSRARTVFTAGGIAVGVATIVALLSFTQGLRDTADEFIHLGGSELGIFQANVSDPTASILPASIVGRIAAQRDVAAATPLLLMVEAVKRRSRAVVFGADPNGFFTHNLVIVAGSAPATGHARNPDRRSPGRTAAPASRRHAAGQGTDATGSRASITRACCSRTPARCWRSPRPRR